MDLSRQPSTRQPPTYPTPFPEVEAVRRFNRFYTQRIGMVTDSVLGSPLTLSQARVIFELEQLREATAVDVAERLGMDRGQLSRILKTLERQGWIARRRSEADGRRRILTLLDRGRRLYEEMTQRSNRQVATMLEELSGCEQKRLIDAMRTIESLLVPEPAVVPCVLRGPGPGDFGHIIQRHGEIYARECGFDEGFEAMVAEITARFVLDHDPQRERLWIADVGGRPMGSVAIVREAEATARLRLFLVEPEARGRGVGKLLLNECVRFSRAKGYERITLITVRQLAAARHLYQRAGFRLAQEKPNRRWSQEVIDEEWVLELSEARRG